MAGFLDSLKDYFDSAVGTVGEYLPSVKKRSGGVDIIASKRSLAMLPARRAVNKYLPQYDFTPEQEQVVAQKVKKTPIIGDVYSGAKKLSSLVGAGLIQAPTLKATRGRVNPQFYSEDDFITKFYDTDKFSPKKALKTYGTDVVIPLANMAGSTMLAKQGLARAGATLGATGVLGGGLSKAFGGDFRTGAEEAIRMTPAITAIGGVTNPLISKLSSTVGAKISSQGASRIAPVIASRAVAGLASVPEGVVMKGAIAPDLAYKASDALIDFGVGAITGSPLSSKLRGVNKAMNVADDSKLLESLTPNQKKAFASGSIEEQARALEHLRLKSDIENSPAFSAGKVEGVAPYKETGDLTTKVLKDLEGKSTVSKQYILDATNRGELKQVERDLIRQSLETEGDTVDVSRFAKKVKAELLPLKVSDSSSIPNRGRDGNYRQSSTRYEDIALPDELRGNVKNYKENVYESPISTSAGDTHFSSARNLVKNYFGHTRIEDMADNKTRRVIEVQSDLYQKGNLESEAKYGSKLLAYDKGELADKIAYMKKKGFEDSETYKDVINALERRTELDRLQQYNDPTAHFRMVREEIKKAAQDGKTKLQFPTGETAMKIEGLGDTAADLWKVPIGVLDDAPRGHNLTPDILDKMVGKEIRRNQGEAWIITDVLGDGKFKAVPKEFAEKIKEFDEASKMRLERGIDTPEANERLRQQLAPREETFDISGKVDTNNPIYKFYEKDVQKYLNKFGGRRIVDGRGVSWVEVPITPDYGRMPVEAFGAVAGLEPYQDEDGNWDVRVNPQKALLGLGIVGGSKILKGKDIEQSDVFNSYLKKMTSPVEKTRITKEGIRKFADDFYTKIVDEYYPVFKEAKAKGGEEGLLDVKYRIKRVLGAGGIADNDYKTMIEPAYKKAKELGIDDDTLNVYLTARRERGFGDIGRNIKGIDAEKAKVVISEIEKKHPNIVGVAEDLYKAQNNSFDLLKGSFISNSQFDKIRKQNPDYVPFTREMDDELDSYLGVGGKKIPQGSNTVKEIKGSERTLVEPKVAIVERMVKTRAAVEKNNAIAQIVRTLGAKKVRGKAVLPIKNGDEVIFRAMGRENDNAVALWENGVKRYYDVGKEVAESLKGMNQEQLNGIIKVLALPSTILRQGATGRNIDFMIPNVIRDQLTAGIYSKHGYIPFYGYISGLKSIISSDDAYKQFLGSGAKISYSSLSGRQGIKGELTPRARSVGGKVVNSVSKLLDVLGKYSEEPTRVGLFKNAVNKTGDVRKAVIESREGSLDFARGGTHTKAANALIPFLRVGINAADTLLRRAKENPKKILALGTAYAALPQLATTAYNIREYPELYAAIPEYIKQNNFIIVTGRDEETGQVEYVTVPKGQEVALIAEPLRLTLEKLAGDSPVDFGRMALHILTDFTPFVGEGETVKEVAFKTLGENLPLAVKPSLENLINTSFFKYDDKTDETKSIVPFYLKDKEPFEQAYKFTPTAYKKIGAVLNISPLQVQNFLEGHLAGYVKLPSMVLESMIDLSEGNPVQKNNIPVLRRLLNETTLNEKAINELNLKVGSKGSTPFDERVGIVAKASSDSTPVRESIAYVTPKGSKETLDLYLPEKTAIDYYTQLKSKSKRVAELVAEGRLDKAQAEKWLTSKGKNLEDTVLDYHLSKAKGFDKEDKAIFINEFLKTGDYVTKYDQLRKAEVLSSEAFLKTFLKTFNKDMTAEQKKARLKEMVREGDVTQAKLTTMEKNGWAEESQIKVLRKAVSQLKKEDGVKEKAKKPKKAKAVKKTKVKTIKMPKLKTVNISTPSVRTPTRERLTVARVSTKAPKVKVYRKKR